MAEGTNADPFSIDDGHIEQTPGVHSRPLIESDRMSQRDYGRPICSRHAVLMECNGSKEEVAYYRCKVEGCREKEIKVLQKYEKLALKNPVVCVKCQLPCEVDLERSKNRRGFLVLQCPGCSYSVDVVRPDVERRARKGRFNERMLDR